MGRIARVEVTQIVTIDVPLEDDYPDDFDRIREMLQEDLDASTVDDMAWEQGAHREPEIELLEVEDA